MNHSCHAKKCKKYVPPKLLMCPQHWKKVPRELQLDVWKHYRIGQEVDKKPTREYLAAARAAINAVAEKEGLK